MEKMQIFKNLSYNSHVTTSDSGSYLIMFVNFQNNLAYRKPTNCNPVLMEKFIFHRYYSVGVYFTFIVTIQMYQIQNSS